MFHVNDRIEITLPNSNDYYPTRIEDIQQDHMIIAMPISHGTPIYLANNHYFFGKIIANNQLYKFTCTLLHKQLHPIPLWRISLPKNIEHIQQRAFVRIHVMMSVLITPLEQEDQAYENQQVYTKDISAGGLQFISKEFLFVGQKVQLTMHFPLNELIETDAEVVRVEENSENQPIVYYISVRYIDLDESRRCKIIQFVYKKQLDLKKRDL